MRFGRTTGPGLSSDEDHHTSLGSGTLPAQVIAVGEPSGYETRLGDLLVRGGVLAPEALAGALKQQQTTKQRVGSLLVYAGALSERDLASGLAAQSHLPLADLSRITLDPQAGSLLPEEVARRVVAIGLGRSDDRTLIVAVAQPFPAVLVDIRAAVAGA